MLSVNEQGECAQVTTSNGNNSGFTLVEMMVAIVIIIAGMLALLESINVAMEYNLKNHLRDEAVYLGEKYINMQRGKTFESLSTAYGTRYEPSKVRGSSRRYSIDMSTLTLSTDPVTPSKQLVVTVKWTYKGVEFQNRVTATESVTK